MRQKARQSGFLAVETMLQDEGTAAKAAPILKSERRTLRPFRI